MKVLIADKLSPKAVTALEELGATVRFEPDLGADDLPAALGDTEVLVVRSTRVTAAAIEAAPALALVIRAGAGFNTIDVEAANARGVYVANCPGKNTDAVAELTIGLLVAADRRLVDAAVALRDGSWRKKEFGQAAGLKDRTLGLIGFGAIGKAVARRAAGMEMRLLVWSRSLTAERAKTFGVGYAATPLDVARQADAVSLHIAAKPETKHLVNREFLEAMKPGAILINASRGEVVDTAALKDAIKAKNLRVALDVYADEPSGGQADFADTELAGMVTGTPHIGASTDQAAEAVAAETVRIVRGYQQTGRPPNTVNLCARTPATHHMVIRHYNRVGVLASIFDGLRHEKINVEEMENIIFADAQTASCTILLDNEPSAQAVQAIRQNENVLQVSVTTR